MSKYTAYLLTDDTQRRLKRRFKPSYPQVDADHITHRFGVEDFGDLEWQDKIMVIGMIDDKNGIQALLVSLGDDKITQRPDGGAYHITWSLDPNKIIPPFLRDDEGPIPYEAKHSNTIIAHWKAHNNGNDRSDYNDSKISVRMLDEPIAITAMPAHVETRGTESRVLNILPKKPGTGYKPWGSLNQQPQAPQ